MNGITRRSNYKKNMENFVVIAIKILSYHMNMNGSAFHVITM